MTQEDIIAAVEKMTVLELSELVKALEDRFGVAAAVPVAAAAGPALADAGAAEEEEKTEFDAVLTEIGPNKIQVIKVVRELTGLGLRESKAAVDEAPSVIREGVPKEEAEAAKAKMEEVGAVVEIK